MKKITFLTTIAVILLSLISLTVSSGLVSAATGGLPSFPHAFCGNVTVNGYPAPDGTLISATVDKGTVLTNSQNPVATVGGSYGINSLPLLVQGEIANGAEITFHVTNTNGSAAGGTFTFLSGGGTDTMDLDVTIEEPEPTPTTTPTPTPTPTQKPSGGGGGGGQSATLTTLTFTGLTASVPLKVNAQGIVQSSTTLASINGIVSLYIARGTRILDSAGSPLKTFSAVMQNSPPAPPRGKAALAAYDLGPQGATFEPALTLSLVYDPTGLPAGTHIDELYIAWWNGTEWVETESTLDSKNNAVSAPVSHFTNYALMAIIPAPAVTASPAVATSVSPTSQPVVSATTQPGPVIEPAKSSTATTPPGSIAIAETTTPAPVSGTNRTLIVALIAGVGVIIALVILVLARRRKTH